METTKTFQELGVSEEILRALEKKGVAMPTRVQEEAIPPLLAWRDGLAKAPTGTGKTFAFGIPMIEHIDPQSDDLQGLILAPTRELAIQIADELRGLLTFYKDIRVTVVYGGPPPWPPAPRPAAASADRRGDARSPHGPL